LIKAFAVHNPAKKVRESLGMNQVTQRMMIDEF
jgi:hypothetical protein